MSDDEFADVKGSLAGKNGIFAASEGLDALDSVTKKFESHGAGIIYVSQCNYCGAPQETLVEWPELVAIAHKRVIQGWYVDRKNGMFRVNQKCWRCQQVPLPWGETPTGAAKDIRDGIEANPALGAQVQAWSQQLST